MMNKCLQRSFCSRWRRHPQDGAHPEPDEGSTKVPQVCSLRTRQHVVTRAHNLCSHTRRALLVPAFVRVSPTPKLHCRNVRSCHGTSPPVSTLTIPLPQPRRAVSPTPRAIAAMAVKASTHPSLSNPPPSVSEKDDDAPAVTPARHPRPVCRHAV